MSAYQIVFAREPGSAEMASAGRPFGSQLVAELVSRGILVAPITLHAGVSSRSRRGTVPLIANAVTTWNTLYIQHALDQQPAPPAAEDLAALTPTLSAHINLLGTYHFS